MSSKSWLNPCSFKIALLINQINRIPRLPCFSRARQKPARSPLAGGERPLVSNVLDGVFGHDFRPHSPRHTRAFKIVKMTLAAPGVSQCSSSRMNELASISYLAFNMRDARSTTNFTVRKWSSNVGEKVMNMSAKCSLPDLELCSTSDRRASDFCGIVARVQRGRSWRGRGARGGVRAGSRARRPRTLFFLSLFFE